MFQQPVFSAPNLPSSNSSLRSAPPTISTSKSLQSAATAKTQLTPLPNNQQSALPSILKNTPFSSVDGKELPQSKIIGFYVNWDDTSFSSLQKNINSLDELIPEWLHLGNENGDLSIDDQAIQDKTMAFVSQNRPNLPIAPLINNFDQNLQDWNSQMLDKMLQNPDARSRTIQNLFDFVTNNKFSGISIDFENVPDADQPLLAQFMKELYAKFHPMGLEVTQSVPLNDEMFLILRLCLKAAIISF